MAARGWGSSGSFVLRLLCLAAHPDDLETYLGGTLRVFAREGARLDFVLASDGEGGTRQPACGTRVDEQRASIAWFEGQIGRACVELSRMSFPDGGLRKCVDELRAGIEARATAKRPDFVFGPDPADPHPDHQALAAAYAAWLASPASKPVPRAFAWLAAEPEHASDVLLLSDEDFAFKRSWIARHASQVPGPGESRAHLPAGRDIVQRIERRERLWGARVGAAFGEPLVRVRTAGGRPQLAPSTAPTVLRSHLDFY